MIFAKYVAGDIMNNGNGIYIYLDDPIKLQTTKLIHRLVKLKMGKDYNQRDVRNRLHIPNFATIKASMNNHRLAVWYMGTSLSTMLSELGDTVNIRAIWFDFNSTLTPLKENCLAVENFCKSAAVSKGNDIMVAVTHSIRGIPNGKETMTRVFQRRLDLGGLAIKKVVAKPQIYNRQMIYSCYMVRRVSNPTGISRLSQIMQKGGQPIPGEEDIYVIEVIKTRTWKGKKQHLIHYTGYPHTDDEWRDARDISYY